MRDDPKERALSGATAEDAGAGPHLRVRNEHGALIGGMPGRRRITLVNQRRLRDLASDESLLLAIRREAPRIVLADCLLGLSSPTDATYKTRALYAAEGYEAMLRNLASAVAHSDDVKHLEHGGALLRPRPWAPTQGLRRRGVAATRFLGRAHGLRDEQLKIVLDGLLGALPT